MLLALSLQFAACSDFFETDPDTIINSDDYINNDDEIYRGYFGILTKLQQAGDHAIILTDTRGDYFDITQNAPLELQQIYNYEPTNGNSYANPSCYYSIVIAANDFISKVSAYCLKTGKSMDEKTMSNVKSMVSCSIRLKVWAYLQLTKIYGKAVWFDDPLEKKKDLSDTSVFTYCSNYQEIISKCLDLMQGGVTIMDGVTVPSNLNIDWASYMNEEKSEKTTNYDHWNYMVPKPMMLNLELHQWRGTKADYEWIRETILTYLDNIYRNSPGDDILNFDQFYRLYYYQCNIPLTGTYYHIFFNQLYNSSNNTNFYHVINGIMYDYNNHQTNRIVEYFCPQSPGQYYLRPSSYAIGKYAESDSRGIIQRLNMNIINNDTCFTKYYYYRGTYLRPKIVEVQPAIPMYRGHDLHFMLAEAENHLGNWRQALDIINTGLINDPVWASKSLPKGWDSRYYFWVNGETGYGNNGIVGCVRGKSHELPMPTDSDYNMTEDQRIKIYDMAIADEALLEFCGEGKSYGYLVRMAEKYNDPAIVADRVCPKYPAAKQATVRAAILARKYWVDWDLKVDSLNK